MKAPIPILSFLFTFLFLWLLAMPEAFAQIELGEEIKESEARFNFYSLTTIDGLSQNSVHNIFQDEHGFMWFATEFGVDRYDGTFDNRETFKLDKDLNENVNFMYENHEDHTLLIGTEKRLYKINCFADNTSDFKVLDSCNMVAACSLKHDNDHTFLFSDHCCYDWNGLLMKEDTNTFNQNIMEINCVAQLDSTIFFLGTNKGLFKYHYQNNSSQLTPMTQKGSTPSKVTHLIFSDSTNTLFSVENRDSLSSLEYYSISEQYDIIDTTLLLQDRDTSAITTLYFDQQRQQLWIGTRFQGLFFFKKDQPQQLYSLKDNNDKINFVQYDIQSLHCSKDGVVWIGTQSSGVFKIQEQKQYFQDYLSKNSIGSKNNHIWSVNLYEHPRTGKRYLLAGTIKDGLALIDKSNPDHPAEWILPTDNSQNAKTIYSITEGKNEFYLGTENGIYKISFADLRRHLDLNTPIAYTLVEFEGLRIPYLFYDHEDNHLWASQRRGQEPVKLHILDIEDGYKKVHTNFTEQFGGERIDVIKKYYWKKNQNTPAKYQYFIGWGKGLSTFTEEDIEVGNTNTPIWNGENFKTGVYAIHHIGDTIDTNDDLWLGTDRKGLIQFNVATKTPTFTDTISGPAKDIIYAILSDSSKNQLWFSTNHGIWKYHINTKTFNQYRTRDHVLKQDEFNVAAFFFYEKDHELFFGGTNGITGFLPMLLEKSNDENDKLAVYVASPHSKMNKTLLFSETDTIAKLNTLPRDFNTLYLTPCVLNYQDPGNNRFQYRINYEGDDENANWKYSSREDRIELLTSDLKRNFSQNSIQIRIRNSHSEWSQPFTIYSRVYPLSFFISVSILAILFLISLLATISRRKKASDKLNSVHDKINDASRLLKLENICKNALHDFISIFEMDYAIISLIDFNERKLVVRGKNNEKNNLDWENLKTNNRTISIDHQDIDNSFLLKCIIGKENIERLDSKDLDIHYLFYQEKEENKNTELVQRFFFPIIHRAKKEGIENRNGKQEEEDLTMGIIEVGYHSKPSNLLNEFNSKDLKNKKINLELYIDNFAQPYYRALLEEKKEELYQLTIRNNLEELNHEGFLRKFIQDLTRVTHSDLGSIALKTLNFPKTNLAEKNINSERGAPMTIDLKDIDPEISENVQFGTHQDGIMRYVMKEVRPYFSNDLPSLKEKRLYIRLFPDIQSEMAAPMIPTSPYEYIKDNSNYVIGALALSSYTPNYFNKIQMEAVNTLTQKATEEYLKIRLRWSLSQLTQPFDIFAEEVKPIYDQIIKSLGGYFDSNYISIWEKERTNFINIEKEKLESNYGVFALAQVTPGLNTAYYRHNLSHGIINEYNHDDNKPLSYIQPVSKLKKDSSIRILCEDKDYQFHSYIVIRIVIDGNYEGFINIFSKRALPEKLKKDDQIFLDQIAEKTAMALQSTRLVSSIRTISESLVEEGQDTTMQQVVDGAGEVLNADLVSLFYYDTEQEYKVKKVTWSGNYNKEHRKEKKSTFANSIIKNGTKYIETEQEYNAILKKAPGHHPKIDLIPSQSTTFWQETKLQSVAAIRLEFNGKYIGVMILNFKSKKNFKKQGTVRFIEGFANLAKAAILNADFLAEVKDNLNILEDKNTKLENQKIDLDKTVEEISFKHEEVQKKMEALIPQAFRTSFYTIVDGNNHDIRNCLMDMQMNIIKIQKNYDRLPPSERNAIDESIKNIDYNVDIIDNLLNLFDLKKRKKTYNNVNELIQKQILYWEHRKPNILFDSSGLDPKIPDLYCFKVDLSMIIFNLVNNAIYAVEKQERTKGKISFETEKRGKNILITIQDNGTGIPEKNRSKIFNAGFTTKKENEGIGIGLYYVEETLRKHFDGLITIANAELGQGTTFVISIPFDKKDK